MNTAFDYAGRGWPVFPVGRNKHPLVKWGKGAASDPGAIEEW